MLVWNFKQLVISKIASYSLHSSDSPDELPSYLARYACTPVQAILAILGSYHIAIYTLGSLMANKASIA